MVINDRCNGGRSDAMESEHEREAAATEAMPLPVELPWAQPHGLTSGHHLEVGKRPSVYRIRAFDEQNRPIEISRAGGGRTRSGYSRRRRLAPPD